MRRKRREREQVREKERKRVKTLYEERIKDLPPLEEGQIRYLPPIGNDLYGNGQYTIHGGTWLLNKLWDEGVISNEKYQRRLMLTRLRRKQKWKEEKRRRLQRSEFMRNTTIPLQWRIRRLMKWEKRGFVRVM